jgi:hypothetical protein
MCELLGKLMRRRTLRASAVIIHMISPWLSCGPCLLHRGRGAASSQGSIYWEYPENTVGEWTDIHEMSVSAHVFSR